MLIIKRLKLYNNILVQYPSSIEHVKDSKLTQLFENNKNFPTTENID